MASRRQIENKEDKTRQIHKTSVSLGGIIVKLLICSKDELKRQMCSALFNKLRWTVHRFVLKSRLMNTGRTKMQHGEQLQLTNNFSLAPHGSTTQT